MADLVITEKAKLVEIANAIREKAGTSDAMAFDALASTIGDIEVGAKIATGTITPASTVRSLTATHNLGVPPKLVVLTLFSDEIRTYLDAEGYYGFTMFVIISDNTNCEVTVEYSGGRPHIANHHGDSMYDAAQHDVTLTYNANATSVSFGRTHSSSRFIAQTYRWMVIA